MVNPSSIEVAVHSRVKTDKRDALKLAGLREAGRLKGVRVPSEKQESQRLLSRTRQKLEKKLDEQAAQDRERENLPLRTGHRPSGSENSCQ